jgi:ATP-dependent RNA helicase RhlE
LLFKDLGLIEPILAALASEGYERPTPIQEQAIPIVLKQRDLLGCAQTGTGKTAAFALPILQVLHQTSRPDQHRHIRVLILTPTRELAIQIDESFRVYGRGLKLKQAVIFGGVAQNPQVNVIRGGIDILTATPGRLLDLMQQRIISLDTVEMFVLDEADRMLDMGFIHDVKRVVSKLPAKRQTLFFSATMPPEIAKLANTILVDPVKVEVTPVSSTAETVVQALYFVERNDKRKLLIHLLNEEGIERALVFTRTKHGADRVTKELNKAGIFSEAIHGDKAQLSRQRALNNFKSGKSRVLVATDIAARGIDVDNLSHVINFELPNIPETYVHRIGRTGRAGATGIALSFCDMEEKEYLRDIHRLVKSSIPVISDHPFHKEIPKGPVVSDGKPGSAPPMARKGMRRKEFRQR